MITINNYRRQMNAQILMKYTERYEHILDQFPPDALVARFGATALPLPSPQLRVAVLKYLNLCAEEYYLTPRPRSGRILWHIWEGDLKRLIGGPLLQREWPLLKKEFESNPEFLDYVERGAGRTQDLEISSGVNLITATVTPEKLPGYYG